MTFFNEYKTLPVNTLFVIKSSPSSFEKKDWASEDTHTFFLVVEPLRSGTGYPPPPPTLRGSKLFKKMFWIKIRWIESTEFFVSQIPSH